MLDIFLLNDIKYYFKRVYGLTKSQLKRCSIINMKFLRNKNNKLDNIFSSNDPIIKRYENNKMYEQLMKRSENNDIDKGKITFHEFSSVAHNSQVALNKECESFCRLFYNLL